MTCTSRRVAQFASSTSTPGAEPRFRCFSAGVSWRESTVRMRLRRTNARIVFAQIRLPWCADTEGEGEDDWPAVRLVESPTAIRPGLRTGVPLELYDTSAGSALQEFIARHRDDAVLGGNDS